MNTLLNEQARHPPHEISAHLRQGLELQRKAYREDPNPSLQQRKADLLSLKRLVCDQQEALIDAINRDYGNRSRHETLIAEIIFVLDGINFALKQLKRWMKPQRRHVDFTSYPGARNGHPAPSAWWGSSCHGISRCNCRSAR
jgi:coniferyl-aldehyde dehydrogenase